MNNKLWEKLIPLASEYLTYIVRFTMWMEAHNQLDNKSPDVEYLRKNKSQFASRIDGLAMLEYPSSNIWIKEEMALWLCLGRLQGVGCDFLSTDHVLQGCEEFAYPGRFPCPVISHYYTHNMEPFYASIGSKVYRQI